ncbi:hypothetical protein CBW46_012765 [Paenibacillus xerothermodurans]|uniref:Uncharacterized protein n=1 Tax=Paenibacillus xerothermodurans TaxID=1977292 RepID=A0A2W1NYM6_PAEXE|nr:hypothetical protein CBW46_012765 [Paenibacillus xerothermodurans]
MLPSAKSWSKVKFIVFRLPAEKGTHHDAKVVVAQKHGMEEVRETAECSDNGYNSPIDKTSGLLSISISVERLLRVLQKNERLSTMEVRNGSKPFNSII